MPTRSAAASSPDRSLQPSDQKLNLASRGRDSGAILEDYSEGGSGQGRNASMSKAKKEEFAARAAKPNGTHIDEDDHYEEPEAEEEEDEYDPEEVEKSLQGTPVKRRKLFNGKAAAASDDLDAEDDDDAEAPTRALASRLEDKYIPGSIVRVELHNFVTYDHAKFHPGPYLNMIIGPNGTGKSTIACAIAIGLGYNPRLLGRADRVSSFVKQGHASGWIELEFKGHEGESNVTIRRNLKLKDDRADYYINGEKTTKSAVTERVQSFNIMIDNLCSFLPQDKVTEFARMNPVQLLRETQKAALDGELLVRSHDKLIKRGQKLRETNSALRTTRAECEALEHQNQRLQRDADRHSERIAMMNRVGVLELCMKFSLYQELLKRMDKMKRKSAAAMEKIKLFDAQLSPLREKQEKIDERVQKCKTQRKVQDEARSKTAKTISKLERDLKTLEQDKKKAEIELDSFLEDERSKSRKIEELRNKIAELEAELATGRPEIDTESLNSKVSSISKAISQKRTEESKYQESVNEILGKVNRNKRTMNNVSSEMAALNSVKDQRLQSLRRSDPDAFKAVMWLRENRHLFSGRVFDPPLLELDVKDRYKGFVNAIENPIRWTTLKTFVCERQADYDILNKHLLDSMRLRVNTFELESVRNMEEQPLYLEQLQALGFTNYAINMISGPDRLLDFMCHQDNLQKIPIGQKGQVDIAGVESSRLFQRFVIGDMGYSLSFSRYGNRQVQSRSSLVSTARNLASGVDREQVALLDKEIERLQAEASQLQEEHDLVLQDRNVLKTDIDQLNAERSELNSKRKEVMAQVVAYEKAKAELKSHRDRLNGYLKRPNAEARIATFRRKLTAFADRLATLTQSLKAQRLVEMRQQHEWNILKLAQLQATANSEAAKQVIEEAEKTGEGFQDDFDIARLEMKKAKKRAMKALASAQGALKEAGPELTAQVHAATDSGLASYAAMEEEILDLQAQLDGAPAVSAEVVRRYNEKKAKIEELKSTIEADEASQQKLQEQIEKRRSNWEPRLQKLIASVNVKFADAFERFNCNGEVTLSYGEQEGPDKGLFFENWCVEIRVKFRQSEELQLLTAERQSGGERSLSTILYLMSLTELGASPFSLVDEINQGMDQRAERLVHDQMVHTTCRENASQYFLITPKLLTGLRYHPLMRVLIINNGEYLPETFDFSKFVKPGTQAQSQGRGGRSQAAAVAA